MRKIHLAPLAAVALLTLAISTIGCGHDAPPAPKTAAAPPPQPTLTSAAVPTKEVTHDLGLSDDIMKSCQVHVANVEEAPKFDFDRAELAPQDRDILAQVAKCVTTGPLKGASLALVGRADSRGETEYNLTLGGSRASAVAQYLRGLGVDTAKLHETSRGELDANGTDEAGWRNDRRVDLQLAK